MPATVFGSPSRRWLLCVPSPLRGRTPAAADAGQARLEQPRIQHIRQSRYHRIRRANRSPRRHGRGRSSSRPATSAYAGRSSATPSPSPAMCVVDSGGNVAGDAIAVFGSVVTEGGGVGGERRSIAGSFGSRLGLQRERAAPAPRSTIDALKLSLGWLVILLLIGFGVQAFAGNYLAGASDVLEQSFWRSFLVGIAGELAILPALILLLVALTVTVVGILLIPFAIVAYVLAVAGLVTLGFLAMARLTGGGVRSGRARDLSESGSTLRGLVMGITLYLGMWVVAAAFQWSPIASGILRALALAITYVAATAGFGAAILSKGGTRRDVAKVQPVADEMAVWQTPTPVTGVVAARRPTPAGTNK